MTQLWESGIYRRWLDYHVGDTKFVREELGHQDDGQTSLDEGAVMFIIFIIGISLAFFIFILELVTNKCSLAQQFKERNASLRTINDLNASLDICVVLAFLSTEMSKSRKRRLVRNRMNRYSFGDVD